MQIKKYFMLVNYRSFRLISVSIEPLSNSALNRNRIEPRNGRALYRNLLRTISCGNMIIKMDN